MTKKPSKSKAKGRKPLKAVGWPESMLNEVRALRECPDKVSDRGQDRSYSCTEHSTECSICGKLGRHTCLPILHAAIEDSTDMADNCWQVFKELEQMGVFDEEDEGVSPTIPLEDLF